MAKVPIKTPNESTSSCCRHKKNKKTAGSCKIVRFWFALSKGREDRQQCGFVRWRHAHHSTMSEHIQSHWTCGSAATRTFHVVMAAKGTFALATFLRWEGLRLLLRPYELVVVKHTGTAVPGTICRCMKVSFIIVARHFLVQENSSIMLSGK
jgi:hypothetical protein